ncbi:hypothetical protein FRC00_003008 [Tulasnella sp. 408]|nr:hypothetical protein FRC00_003008 [Tulasnella sp. 408]
MPQKKKQRRVPWNKINNQQNSTASASSWAQGLPETSGNTQAYQAELAKLYPLAAPNAAQSTTSIQSSQSPGPSNQVLFGLPSLPQFSFHVPYPQGIYPHAAYNYANYQYANYQYANYQYANYQYANYHHANYGYATHFGQGDISLPVNPRSAEGRALSFPSPSGPDFFSRLPPELLLNIMENLYGEDVIALRRASPQIMRILEGSEHNSRVWKTIRLAAGVPAIEGGQQSPSPSELTEIRVTKFRDFIEEWGELFDGWANLREAIPWVTASGIPGLTELGGALVARKTWAEQVAQDLKWSVSGRKKKEIKKDTESINSCILKCLKASRTFALSIVKLHPTKIAGVRALSRLARQRQKWYDCI